MTEEFSSILLTFLQNPVRNVIINFGNVTGIDNASAEAVVLIQQRFYENNSSFVACHLHDDLTAQFDSIGLLEMLNAVPTESEAYDIVQMEEIERELLGDENP